MGVAYTWSCTSCCGKQGHAEQCQAVLQMSPKPQPKPDSLDDGHAMLDLTTIAIVGTAVEPNPPHLLMLQGVFADKDILLLVDTGASHKFLSKKPAS